MEAVHISASRDYDIYIGKGIITDAGRYIREVSSAHRAAIVTDDIVNDLYADIVEESLLRAGFEVIKFVFKNGEMQKSHLTLMEIYAFLADNQITRTDIIIALGGGVVGDVTGYAAATYLRGIDFVQIPTTLLAQVDSSVGGKTAVNIEEGKNLVGAFYQPVLVLCDVEMLDSLSNDIFSDGMAEVIKYGMIKSAGLFELLLNEDARENIIPIVTTCVKIKAQFVERDERDTGERMLLNFGHTLGHALEKYYNYDGISHGKGVAIGMRVFTERAESIGFTKQGTTARLIACLERAGLPTNTEIPLCDLIPMTMNDKKRSDSSISIVLCREIGKAVYKKLPLDEYTDFLKG